MKVILCTGGPQSGHEQVFGLLLQAGLAPAQPASQALLPPQSLQTKLLHSQEVDLLGTAPLAQVQPGKLWGQVAADLLLANIHNTAWGWADHQTTVLMDFWKDFDPQVRLLLAYNSPQAYLAQVLAQHTPPAPQVVADTLDEWARWNTALLRYYHRHPSICVLVNTQQACMQPQTFVDTLAAHWQISGLDSTTVRSAGTPAYPHLQAHLINQIIDPHHPALALHQELEGAAPLLATPSANPTEGPTAVATPSATAAWADWVQVRANLAQLTQDHTKSIADSEALARAKVELGTLAESKLQASAHASELTQENELLLLQLHQVQEELEHYFLRAQELEQSSQSKANGFVTDFWRMHQPAELVINMQHDIAGSNWYPPESDGRWAGPATLSTLQMPPVQPGNYTLELDIVDAMSLGLVNTLVVEALGQTQPVEVFYPLYQGEYPLVCKVPLSISPSAAQQPWDIGLRFAQTVCPADSGSDDRRNLTARLRSVKLVKQA